MSSFTKQERIVLLVLAFVMLAGSSLHYAFKKYPYLRDIVNFMDSEDSYHKVNINTASEDDLVRIPYIGSYTARNIIEYRQENGYFTQITQIKLVKGIKEKNYKKFYKYLRISKQNEVR